MLAPWNASRFPYGNSVLWHFHGLKLTRNQDGQSYNLNIGAGFYTIPNVVQENVYKPYIQDLNGAISKMNSLL